MTTNLNLHPYYDDYNALKDFHQVLFKPGYPVQARELTQIQTILQNQISRFGDNIFTNGSRVTGGKVTVNSNVYSVTLNDGQSVSSLKVGQYIKGQTNGLIAEIVNISTESSTTKLTYVPRGNSSIGFIFDGEETLIPYTDATLTNQIGNAVTTIPSTTFQVVATGSKGNNFLSVTAISDVEIGSYIQSLGLYVIGIQSTKLTLSNVLPYDISATSLDVQNRASFPSLLVGVGDGIFYVNGLFSRLGSQSVIPNHSNRWVTASVGIILVEDIVTSEEDFTLLDPAQGSYNFNAPGADRLRHTLTLVSYDDSVSKDPSFIELVRIENGNIIRQNDYSTYGEIMNAIARRTYDQSGNYVVDPFIIRLTDTGDSSTFNAVINPGKAYINGFEFKTIAPYTLKIKRSLETETTTDLGIDTYLGNYVIINNVVGQIPLAGTTINFIKNSSTVGTAVIIQVSPSQTGLRLYLANINGDITGSTKVSVGGFSANIVANIVDTAYKSLVFKTPQTYIKNITNMSYTMTRLYKSVVFTNGNAVISAFNTNERFVGGSGIISLSVANANYGVFDVDGATLSKVDIKTVVNGTLAQCEISINNASFNGVGNIVAKITVNDDAGRVKILSNASMQIDNLSTTAKSLKKSDLYKLEYASVVGSANTFEGDWKASTTYDANDMVAYNGVIYISNVSNVNKTPDLNSTEWIIAPDVSSTLVVDNGQRDLWYEHATIKTTSTTYSKLAVAIRYFKHTGSGPIVVNSYPVEYANIPEYKGMSLRDCIDLRPRRVDDETILAFDSVAIADDEGVSNVITYYLSRIDKIVLSNNRSFYTLSGVSSYNAPLPPADISDAMTLATLVIPPYTDDITKIRVDVTNNKRYTMKDIGKIEQRVSNIEYYTSLNSIENKVINSVQYSPSGVELFKSGFLTDSFDNFNVGNVTSPEYKCSISAMDGVCRPQFKMNATALAVNTGLTIANVSTNLVTLPFTKEEFIKNIKASGFVNINQFNAIGNIGVATISPTSDFWFDTKNIPVINVLNENTEAFIVAQKNAASLNQSANWGAWNTIWAGTPATTQSGYKQITTDDVKQQRFKSQQVMAEVQVANSDNTIVVSKEIQPYARENVITFSVSGLTPYSHVFVWIDDHLVNPYVTPDTNASVGSTVQSIEVVTSGVGYTYANVSFTGGSGNGASAIAVVENGKVSRVIVTNIGTNYTTEPVITITGDGSGATAVSSLTKPSMGSMMTTDIKGSCSGKLVFPNDENLKFTSGTHRIVFSDTFERANATSYADVIYSAEGYISTVKDNVVSTRSPLINTNNVNEYITSSNVSTRDITSVINYEDQVSLYTSVDPNATYFGIDSDTSKPLTLSEFYDGMAAYYDTIEKNVQTQEILDVVVSAYALNTAGSSIRNVGSQKGLPDTKSAAYWIHQVLTGHIQISDLTSVIAASARAKGESSFGCPVKDPLAQSFIISAEQFQNGCFVSEFDLFFASKDPTMPVTLELRPLVNGFPSSNVIIPLSTVVKYPEDINVNENGVIPTTFTFSDPIYLAPGEYAIVLNTTSNKYSVCISEMNAVQLGTNNIISDQPYVGNLFESQNASTWSAEQFKDLCFTMRICKFSTYNNIPFVLDNKEIDIKGDIISLLLQNIQPAKTAINTNVVLPTFSGSIPMHKDILMPAQFNLTSIGSARVYTTLYSTDAYVSPVIDLERVSMICIENIIDAKADLTTPETDSRLGSAKAKYVTKTVTLNEGFNATSLVTHLNINRPSGSTIEVYARFKNEFDTSSISGKGWVLLTQEHNGGNTSQTDQYVEDTWSVYDYTYNGFNNFNQFEVKVVMHSTNTSKVPVISDIRVIALA